MMEIYLKNNNEGAKGFLLTALNFENKIKQK